MSGVGLTVPKLMPITGTWAGPFAFYYCLLSCRVVNQRLKTEHYIGDRPPNSTCEPGYDPLETESRAQGNFIENVPLAFILLGVAELNGGNRKALHYVMAALFALRVAHVEGGLRLKGKFGGGGVGRPVGFFGTVGVLGGLGGYASYLVKEYWGF
ncbi:hypothetical protein D0Z07_1346 [Hyphodiscus hymeniophilus]|uniref:Uncharacterized protein n=1 Tax=Hyphodiscus hymeniophilus TaxID=353542 RepID=A0A9P6VRD0_9HELO|nr:hypothetical protein D0Z07_1346 [Hyphodiscus hymeniophilus]